MTPLLPLLYVSLGLLLFSIHSAPPCSAGATTDTLGGGRALAAGDRLVSGNGKFTLGFFRPSATVSKSGNITSPNWYLGIWFSNISVLTTVWVGNRDKPVPDLQLNLTQLKLSRDGDLVISNNATGSVIWSTSAGVVNRTRSASSTNTSTSAVLSNNGNLVVGSSSGVLWQSFDYPSDVLLSGAKFGWNKNTGHTSEIISKKNMIDPGLGLYSVVLNSNGLALTYRNPYMKYWSWPQSNKIMLVPLLTQLAGINPQTRGVANFTYVDDEQEEYYMYTLLDESSLMYVLLDISGQIQIYSWSKSTQSWANPYSQPADPCTAYATCGPFTICNGVSRPFCGCMQGFTVKSPQDWELDDRRAGCFRNTPLDCGNTTSSSDVFYPVARVALPNTPSAVDAATQSSCAQACLSHCSCTAYSYENSKCSIWHGELLSVNLNDGLDNTSEDVLYIRVAAKDLPRLRKGRRKPATVAVVTAAAGVVTFGLVILLLLLLLLLIRRNRLGGSQGSGGIVAFRYTDLCHATKNFSEKLGGGGFGSVYKGVLSDSTIVAVKKLDGARQGEKQFRAEVSTIGLIQHINLVKLIGFCCEGDERLLVYEHMQNGSLDVHLFQSNADTTVLSWATRYNLAIGVARGLSYLHQSCHECIIHCDIKPENILVDASFVPKIADFGMAAFVGRNFSRVLTTFRGTIGYLAPEWISGVAVTPKVDVYSFGMVLLEIMSGRRNSPNGSDGGGAVYFPVHAITKLHEGDVRSLVDTQLRGDFDLEEAERVCKVACWCIQENELDRPTMSEVVRVLEGLQELELPPMPRLLAAMTEYSNPASM